MTTPRTQPSVLVVGARGALGSLVADAFQQAGGWSGQEGAALFRTRGTGTSIWPIPTPCRPRCGRPTWS